MKQWPIDAADALPTTTDVDSLVPNDASPGRRKNDDTIYYHFHRWLHQLITGQCGAYCPSTDRSPATAVYPSSIPPLAPHLLISSLLLVRNLAHLAQTMARGAQRVLKLKNLNLSHRPWLADDGKRGACQYAHTCCSISRTLNSCEPSFE